jgi:hypothetical protein
LYNWQTRGLYSLGSPNAIRVVDFINTTVWGLTFSNQAADSSILEYNGSTYLFYSHDDNTNGAGRLGYSKFGGTLSDYDACFIPSASPTITNTVTITPTPTYDETLGPILTQIAAQWSPTQTLTMTPTSTSTTTITATFTATPTVTPGSHVLNGQNLVSIDTVISSPIGYQRVNWSTTLSWNPYSYTDLVQVFQVPVSTKLKILQGTNYLDIYVTDYLGNTVDCSATNALLGLMLLHN